MSTSLRLVFLTGLLLASTTANAAPPEDRTARLSRGVNIPHWFWLAEKSDHKDIAAYVTDSDAKQLRAAGFTHVRVPIDPRFITTKDSTPATPVIDPAAAALLKATIKRLTAADLAVMIDAHPLGTKAEHLLADKSPKDWADNLDAFWKVLAPALADTDPQMVFLELLNEPNGITDHAEWPRVQSRFLTTVRSACPSHTIVLTGDDWGNIDGLLRLTPASDDNVVYSFHFYESHTFTHQTAGWGAPFWKHIKDLPYPSTPEIVEPIAKKTEDTTAAWAIREYGKEHWNAQKIATRIDKAAAWGRQHGTVIYCGEFGAIKAAPSRITWLHDVAKACADRNIGLAIWDYTGGFSIAHGAPGKRTLDQKTLEALSLTPLKK